MRNTLTMALIRLLEYISFVIFSSLNVFYPYDHYDVFGSL